jgi:hypothetical protein
MNPNYDDHDDFYGEEPRFQKMEEFLEQAFSDVEESLAPVCDNIDCTFTDNVLEYLCLEWEADLGQYPHNIQQKAMDVIQEMKCKDSVSNVAVKIAMEVLPL